MSWEALAPACWREGASGDVVYCSACSRRVPAGGAGGRPLFIYWQLKDMLRVCPFCACFRMACCRQAGAVPAPPSM